jgi:hypothetical protein
MELNRNHYFMMGIVLLFLGLQFRVVQAYVLTEEASKVVTKFVKKAQAETNQKTPPTLFFFSEPPPIMIPKQHKWYPPKWIGWLLVSGGAVLILHSLAMKRPE